MFGASVNSSAFLAFDRFLYSKKIIYKKKKKKY
jgi:hypothetical protein